MAATLAMLSALYGELCVPPLGTTHVADGARGQLGFKRGASCAVYSHGDNQQESSAYPPDLCQVH